MNSLRTYAIYGNMLGTQELKNSILTAAPPPRQRIRYALQPSLNPSFQIRFIGYLICLGILRNPE
jgi:hypothetical protein